jgi:hypothetical protein
MRDWLSTSESCISRLINKKSVLDEFTMRRFAVIQELQQESLKIGDTGEEIGKRKKGSAE